MKRRYYSSRNNPQTLSLKGLYWKLQHLYSFFRDKGYFHELAGITKGDLPDSIKHEAALSISFQPFPITKWEAENITEDHILDVLEFLYDRVSKPGELVYMTSDTGYNYQDYDGYDKATGQAEFRGHANGFLSDYKRGFELTEDGRILSAGEYGLKAILDAQIEPYDEENVDSKVREAIVKWRNRQLDMNERRHAIQEMASVFEWLKKTKQLEKVLAQKDTAALFEIANKFAIRHHEPKQRKDYDAAIWYPWMFHFYLATYHAAIRLLKKGTKKKGVSN